MGLAGMVQIRWSLPRYTRVNRMRALRGVAMNLRQIEAFLAVFEEGTFSAGAARLKVSQPTVSKLVDALERGLGYRLFRRTGARVTPTDHGMALYRDMTRVKRGFDFLLHQAKGLKAAGGGDRLVVGAGSALCGTLAPR